MVCILYIYKWVRGTCGKGKGVKGTDVMDGCGLYGGLVLFFRYDPLERRRRRGECRSLSFFASSPIPLGPLAPRC